MMRQVTRARAILADHTITDQSVIVYSEVSDEDRKRRLRSWEKPTGWRRVSSTMHRWYKRILLKALNGRLLRKMVVKLHRLSQYYVAGNVMMAFFMILASTMMAIPAFLTHALMIAYIALSVPVAVMIIAILAGILHHDHTLKEDHVTTHRVLDDHHREHTVIISNIRYTEEVAALLKMSYSELNNIGYDYYHYDLSTLSIWSPIPLSEVQRAALLKRDALMIQHRSESLDTIYDLRDDTHVGSDHHDDRFSRYDQCIDLIQDNRRLIDGIGQPVLADQLDVIQRRLSDVQSHGLDMASSTTMRDLEDVLAQLDHMHDQLLVLNDDCVSVHNSKLDLSYINKQLDTMTSTVSTVVSE